MIPHQTNAVTPNADGGRNAPNINNRLSLIVDATQAVVDDARAIGMHGVADELDTIRERIAGIALRLWRAEGGSR